MNLQFQKVINGLECCISEGTDCPEDCPYIGDCNRDKLHSDALALIKAQEPIIVHDMILGIDGWGGYCPVCGSFLLEHHNKHFCGNCGQAVKWND